MSKIYYNDLYRKAINSSFWGLHTLINNILGDTNIHHKQIGGEITKFTIDNQDIKADVVYNKNFDEISIQVINLKGTEECGVIIIYKDNPTTAIIQNIQGKDRCYETTINRTNDGKIIIKLLIKLCKYYKIKKILLADHSIKKIGDYDLELKIYNTLINGKPWYCQFGFINSNDKDQQIIIDNFNKLNGKKVSNFPKEIFISKKFIELYDKYKDNDIKEFIRMLSLYDIKRFYDIYDKLYKKLGLRNIKNKEYYLNL